MDNENGKLLVQAGKSALNIILKQPAKPIYLQGAYCLAYARPFHRGLPAPDELLIKKEGQHLFPDGPEWIVTQHGTLLALSYYFMPVPSLWRSQSIFISSHRYKLRQRLQNLDHAHAQR